MAWKLWQRESAEIYFKIALFMKGGGYFVDERSNSSHEKIDIIIFTICFIICTKYKWEFRAVSPWLFCQSSSDDSCSSFVESYCEKLQKGNSHFLSLLLVCQITSFFRWMWDIKTCSQSVFSNCFLIIIADVFLLVLTIK